MIGKSQLSDAQLARLGNIVLDGGAVLGAGGQVGVNVKVVFQF
jgi:hypothetical protein